MKPTGIVRRIDDLGRIVVPKEIRRVLRIREGDPLEIYTGASGEIILKKYSPIFELNRFADEYAETVSKLLDTSVFVSDTDRIISVYGASRKDFIDKKIDEDVDDIIQRKQITHTQGKIVVPIISQGDPIGSIIIISKEGSVLGETELKAAEIGAHLLSMQTDS